MFQFLKVLLIKICKIQSLDPLFIVVFISFYISRYNFYEFLQLHSTLSEKKIFFTNFLFLTDFFKSEVININFRQIWHSDLKGTMWVGMEHNFHISCGKI